MLKRPIFALGLCACVAVLLSSCDEEMATPTVAPVPVIAITLFNTPVPAPASTLVWPSVSLSVLPGLASGSNQQHLSAQTAPADAPFWIGHPEHTLITFSGYARTATLHAPSIKLYAVRDLLAFNDLTRMRVEGLRAALSERPTQPRGVVVADIYREAQMLQIQPKYLDFQGGSGVRYITQYVGDSPVPINNRELFYTFQGLSGDGQFLISVILPIAAPGLPDDGSIGVAQLGGALNAPEFQNYMKQIDGTLGALPAEQFSPGLGGLDQLISSLKIG